MLDLGTPSSHHCEYPTGWLRATPRIGLTHPFTEAQVVVPSE